MKIIIFIKWLVVCFAIILFYTTRCSPDTIDVTPLWKLQDKVLDSYHLSVHKNTLYVVEEDGSGMDSKRRAIAYSVVDGTKLWETDWGWTIILASSERESVFVIGPDAQLKLQVRQYDITGHLTREFILLDNPKINYPYSEWMEKDGILYGFNNNVLVRVDTQTGLVTHTHFFTKAGNINYPLIVKESLWLVKDGIGNKADIVCNYRLADLTETCMDEMAYVFGLVHNPFGKPDVIIEENFYLDIVNINDQYKLELLNGKTRRLRVVSSTNGKTLWLNDGRDPVLLGKYLFYDNGGVCLRNLKKGAEINLHKIKSSFHVTTEFAASIPHTFFSTAAMEFPYIAYTLSGEDRGVYVYKIAE